MISLLLAGFLIMCASLVGVFFVWKKFGTLVEKNLGFLVSFSAGVFLIIAGGIMSEIFAHASVQDGVGAVALGLVFMWVMFKVIPSFHHHHNAEEEHGAHSKIDAKRIIFGDAIHNIGDGVLLVTAFSIDFNFGVLTTLSIFIHELVQETSEFFVMKEAGFSTKKALAVNFLVSGTIIIGILLGTFLLEKYESIELTLFGLSAGAFLFVVFKDLIPHSFSHGKSNNCLKKHFLFFLFGVLIMFGVTEASGHSHEHEEEHEHLEEGLHENEPLHDSELLHEEGHEEEHGH